MILVFLFCWTLPFDSTQLLLLLLLLLSLLLFIDEYYICLPLMTGLTLWSLWCVATSRADQKVNEGRINTLEASEILIFFKEFQGVFTPTAGSLWSESGDELATRCLSPIGLISNCPANQNPPTKSLVTAVACSLVEFVFFWVISHQSTQSRRISISSSLW